jgi:DNA-binding transcriptional LysR family regulator
MDTIEGMRTFVAVARAGSFTAAGERLGRSTALVSKYVGQLEERLQLRLLERTTRSLRLTEIGSTYLERAEALLEQFDELETALGESHSAPSGKLRVSASLTFGEFYIASMVSKFVCRFPEVSVDLGLTDRFVNLVDEGVDVAIRISEMPDSSMIARRLCPSRIVCCAAPSYLERRGHPEVPKDLRTHDCIIDRNLRNANSWPFVVEGKRVSVKTSGRVSVNGAGAARAVAVEGAGIGLIPSFAIGDDLRAGRLVPLLTEHDALSMSVYAIYPHRQHLAAKTRAFVDFLADSFGPEPSWDRA